MLLNKDEIMLRLNNAIENQSIYVVVRDSNYGVRVLVRKEIKRYKWFINGLTPDTFTEEIKIQDIWDGSNILDLTGVIGRMQKQ